MSTHRTAQRRCALASVFAFALGAGSADAQVTPAAGYTPPDDTPAIRIGATIFADYTVTTEPKQTDVDGNTFTPSAFNIGRAYLNVTGQINHMIAFRVTPDIVRETGTGSSLAGSYIYRLKYAYAQFNMDDWMTRGSWARFGMQQTPWVDFMETVYRYRFQGTIFEDREILSLVFRRRRELPLQLRRELRRRPRRLLQRRELQPRRDQRPEGLHDARHRCGRCRWATRRSAACASPVSTTTTPTSRTPSASAASPR